MRKRIAHDMLSELGVDFDAIDVENHVHLRNLSGFAPTADYLTWAEGWLERLVHQNQRTPTYPEPEFSQAAAERWGLLQARALATGTLPSGLTTLPARAFTLARALPSYLELARGFATAQGMRLR